MTRERVISALRRQPRTLDDLSRNLGIDKATIRSVIADLDKKKPRKPRVLVNGQGELYVEGGPDHPVPAPTWMKNR